MVNPVINYDARGETEGEKEPADIMSKIGHIRVKWGDDDKDLEFFFSQLELNMQCAQVAKQWMKRLVLANNLPAHITPEVKPLLRLQEASAGNMPYHTLKLQLMKIFGSKKEEAYDKACDLHLTTTQSQLARTHGSHL